MSNIEMILPESPILTIKNVDGIVLLEIEPVTVDYLISRCQKSKEGSDEPNIHAWLHKFTAELNNMVTKGYRISMTQAHFIAVKSNEIMLDLKKKLAGSEDSSEHTDSPQ